MDIDESILVSKHARLIPKTNAPVIKYGFNHGLLVCAYIPTPARPSQHACSHGLLQRDPTSGTTLASARTLSESTSNASDCLEILRRRHAGDTSILSDKTTAGQSRVLVLPTRSGSKYAFTSTMKACPAFRAPILAEALRRKVLDTQQWYVAQLTRGDCIPMRELFGGVDTPEALHRQMTKDGAPMSLERRGNRIRLISFDRQSVPPLHLVKGEGMCEDYVRR